MSRYRSCFRVAIGFAATLTATPAFAQTSPGTFQSTAAIGATGGVTISADGSGRLGAAKVGLRSFDAEAWPIEVAPKLDGLVVDDPAWENVPVISEFWQTRPSEGAAATERTEVRISFDHENIYIGVVCFDREPGAIIVSDSRRDASLDNTDSFSFILDTYKDGQNGFVFGTNPAGIQYDAQVTREGQVGFGNNRQSAGSGAGFNINWDAVWSVVVKTTSDGWSAEFAIPFKTLRYPKGSQQTWGINFQRNIGRKKESVFWTRLERQYNLNRVSMAGTLHGIRVPSLRNLSVMPYALTLATRNFVDPEYKTSTRLDGGLDVKYGITPSLTMDATLNTDFAQVEVDEQQINLDRFQLFFPEKRPFFLENAGLFSVAEDGEVELFFSRRIGISESGAEVPILGGARLSGTAAGTRLGFLSMQTGRVSSQDVSENDVPQNNFTAARVQRELANRSAIGFLVTNRNAFGRFASEQDYNRLLAVDGRLGIGAYGQVSGFIARSFTPDVSSDQFAGYANARYDSQAWRLSAGYTQLGTGFNPEVGFLSRQAYRKMTASVFNRYRVPNEFLGFHELRPHATYRAYWGVADGFQETGYLHLDSHWEWRSGEEIHTGLNFTKEGVREEFEISEGVFVPSGTYDHREAQLIAFTSPTRRWDVSWRGTFGGFFGGDRASNSIELGLRLSDAFVTNLSVSRNDISLPDGDFSTNLVRARVSYSFSPQIYVQALVQYNDRSEQISANMRFGWLREANTGLFIVLNQISRSDALLEGDVDARGITVKYTHFFDVLR